MLWKLLIHILSSKKPICKIKFTHHTIEYLECLSDFFKTQIASQFWNISYFCICMKTLTCRQISNSFIRKLCRWHHFNYVKTSPANVISKHFKLKKLKYTTLIMSKKYLITNLNKFNLHMLALPQRLLWQLHCLDAILV